MGIGASIFLIAVGAILNFGVDVNTEGFDLNTIGLILMIVGVIGLLMTMLFWSDWAPGRRGGVVVDDGPVVARRRGVLVDDAPVVSRRRRTVYEDDVV